VLFLIGVMGNQNALVICEILGEVKKAVEFFIASGATIASVQGVTHYHTPFVTPYWIFAECMVYLGQVDNHLFYICDK
jgi:hypothetical protein